MHLREFGSHIMILQYPWRDALLAHFSLLFLLPIVHYFVSSVIMILQIRLDASGMQVRRFSPALKCGTSPD